MFRRTPDVADVSAEQDQESITALLRRLGTDTSELLRAEVALAKLEFRDMARQAALDGAKVGAAVALAMVGVLALGAAAVLALGHAFGDSYATAALVFGAVLLVIAGLLARWGVKGMQRGPRPAATAATMRENRAWAAAELGELKQQLGKGTGESRARLPDHS